MGLHRGVPGSIYHEKWGLAWVGWEPSKQETVKPRAWGAPLRLFSAGTEKYTLDGGRGGGKGKEKGRGHSQSEKSWADLSIVSILSLFILKLFQQSITVALSLSLLISLYLALTVLAGRLPFSRQFHQNTSLSLSTLLLTVCHPLNNSNQNLFRSLSLLLQGKRKGNAKPLPSPSGKPSSAACAVFCRRWPSALY